MLVSIHQQGFFFLMDSPINAGFKSPFLKIEIIAAPISP